MENCNVPYIPVRLHTLDKPDIPLFKIGEYLFYRCKKDNIETPFDGIKLSDVSLNREGERSNPLSMESDVLFNINPENLEGEKYNLEVVTLELKEIDETLGTYLKTIVEDAPNEKSEIITHTCKIILLHEKYPCNYSHSIFQFELDGVIITPENYNNNFGKKTKWVSRLRTVVKTEISKMILRKEIKMNWNDNSVAV